VKQNVGDAVAEAGPGGRRGGGRALFLDAILERAAMAARSSAASFSAIAAFVEASRQHRLSSRRGRRPRADGAECIPLVFGMAASRSACR
jgi:hypothetical protein